MRPHFAASTLFRTLTFLFLAITLSGCSKDDEETSEDPFYQGRLTNVNAESLHGTWAILKVTYNGVTQDVPENSEACGRDFLAFRPGGIYSEHYLTDTSACFYEQLSYQWQLKDGIITLSNSLNETEEMVIESLSANQFVFRIRIDLDDDGVKDIFTMTAYRYTPKDLDIYSYTFTRNNNHEHTDKLRFDWLAYQGNNPFDRYEIYRSSGVCSKANATLVATITDKNQNYFIDEDPPAADNLCYYLKIYNEKGLLAESIMVDVETWTIDVPMVQLKQPEISGQTIGLSWEPYQGYYFSHYEIAVRNYTSAVGAGSQEYTLAIIDNKETLSYTDEDPPVVKDPVYAIYAVNIFGTKTAYSIEGGNLWEVAYSHPQLLSFSTIEKTALSKTSPLIFLFGRTEEGSSFKLCSYNYETGEMAACAEVTPNISTGVDMKVVETAFGEELIFPAGNAFMVYDASNLAYKYETSSQSQVYFQDFTVLETGTWVLTDHDQVYTFTRNQELLTLADQIPHFSTHQSYTGYGILELSQGSVLVGHPDESSCIQFNINPDHSISLVNQDIPFRMSSLYFDPVNEVIVNGGNKTILDASSFEVTDSYTSPAFTFGIHSDGKHIYGTKNDPEGSTYGLYPHEKNLYLFDRSAGASRAIPAKGYPHLVFEGIQGNLISISSGLLRDNLQMRAPKNDLFIEKTTF